MTAVVIYLQQHHYIALFSLAANRTWHGSKRLIEYDILKDEELIVDISKKVIAPPNLFTE